MQCSAVWYSDTTSMLEELNTKAALIQKLQSNYNKDPSIRKTREYLQKRKELLETYWTQFNEIAEEFPVEEIDEIVYFTKKCYKQVITDIDSKLANSEETTVPEPTTAETTAPTPPSAAEPSTLVGTSTSKSGTETLPAAPAPRPASTPISTAAQIAANEVFPINNMPLDMGLALRFIPEYDGLKSCSAVQFIACCDALYTPLTTEDEKKQFTNVLHCKLRGKAYTILEYNPNYLWPEVKNEIKKQFLDSRTYEGILSDLLNCAQNKLTVLEFANKVDRLKCDLNSACSQILGADEAIPVRKLNERVALKGFEDGLKPGLKLLVKARAFKNLQEAAAYAVAEDKQFTDTHYSHKSSHSFSVAPTNKSIVKQEPKDAENSFQTTNVYCKYCKKKGHNLQNCRKKPTSSGNSSAGQSKTDNTVPAPKIN